MTNSEQVAFNAMLRDCENALFVPEQSMKKTIEVEFCEEQIEVVVEIFNHDDQATFEILHAAKDGVDILHIIEALGGLSKLSVIVEQKLKEENFNG